MGCPRRGSMLPPARAVTTERRSITRTDVPASIRRYERPRSGARSREVQSAP
ncbi:Hypothetical protein A7982_03411 [Minicystis rosea]|nr:Hypothetical protein A7982_03411 [Minicystis rosea]